MTKTCLTTVIIWRAHHIIAMSIKKIIAKFKDKACGIPITEFIGLKSQIYSYVKDNEKGGQTANDIKKNVIKNNIKHEDYTNTLKITNNCTTK